MRTSKFDSIEINYDRRKIDITSHDKDIRLLMEQGAYSESFYFGGDFTDPQLSLESFKGCIPVKVQRIEVTQTFSTETVTAELSIELSA